MKHPDEQELLLHLYEADPSLASHLQECAACRERSGELQTVLASLSSAAVPERGDFYGKQVWHRLEPRLDTRRPRFRWPRLVLAGALAALLVGAFLAGRQFPAPQQGISAAARERLLLDAIGEHLERSQMVLTDVAGESANERADRLVSSSRLYRTAAERAGEENLARLLEELERVLLEVARAPASASDAERQELLARVQTVLFKVRVLGQELRERERPVRSRSKRGLA